MTISRHDTAVAPDHTGSLDYGDTLTPTFGVLCLLTFCFVSISQRLPLGPLAAVGTIAAAALRGRQFEVPTFYRWYLGYIAIGAAGWMTTRYPAVVSSQLLEVIKVALVGIGAFNVVCSPRTARSFVVWYLALFAFFPVRGALFNYVYGITENGRVAWNFFFSNPNDLAMTCFLPLGLCAYLIFLESKRWIRGAAWVGVVTIAGVQMLTQSRGAMLALAAGILYFAAHTKRKLRTLIMILLLSAIAAAATPGAVWDRVAGLSKLTGNIHQVDPEGSASGRATLMSLAWKTALDNRALGVGLGAYAYENARIARGDLSIGIDERGERDAHSSYIRAAAETGLCGGFCIAMLTLSAISFCRTCRRKAPAASGTQRPASALLALEASMVAYALGAIVNSAETSSFFLLQAVIPCALASVLVQIKIVSPATPEAHAEKWKKPIWKWPGPLRSWHKKPAQ